MPRLAIDYSKTIMYRIVCKDPTIKDCYVGSTTNFTKRKTQHKGNCDNEKYKNYNINVYQFIREHNGWDNFDMIEIEKYNAKDQHDQARRERYWLEFYGATLNKQVPSRSQTEYQEKNKEIIAEQKKEYYKENKEDITNRIKKYREENKEQYINYNKIHREENKEHYFNYSKEYREQHKEHYIEYFKNYREENKDKISEKITCVCGSICRRSDISRHLKSKKHQLFILNISSNNLTA